MAAYIQVVLREPLKNLGNSGDLVRVRPGFARNYLVPRQIAVYATEKNISKLEHDKREAIARAAKLRAEADATAAKLSGATVTIRVSAGADNRLYGSVTAKDIAAALAEIGHTVDRRKIALEQPIRTLGTHELTVKLGPETSSTFKVEVVKAEGLSPPGSPDRAPRRPPCREALRFLCFEMRAFVTLGRSRLTPARR